jgi:hypothetical protein
VTSEPPVRTRVTRLVALLLVVLTVGSWPAPAAWARYDTPAEDYADYQPQTTCRRTVQPGTAELARWINRRFAGGTARATLRACGSGGTSEHKDGRAIDWSMDAGSRADRITVRELLTVLRAPDAEGNEDALARRMGVMYLIWNDHMYAAWHSFDATDYLSGGCKSLARCSRTLRHRDHVHISLGRPGARALTSWYAARTS